MQLHCCGATNYSDWLNVKWYPGNETTDPVVPVSCCATVGGCDNDEFILGDEIPEEYKVWTKVYIRLCDYNAYNCMIVRSTQPQHIYKLYACCT